MKRFRVPHVRRGSFTKNRCHPYPAVSVTQNKGNDYKGHSRGAAAAATAAAASFSLRALGCRAGVREAWDERGEGSFFGGGGVLLGWLRFRARLYRRSFCALG